jgi:hypothetical protein
MQTVMAKRPFYISYLCAYVVKADHYCASKGNSKKIAKIFLLIPVLYHLF